MDTHAEQLICKVTDGCASPAEREELQRMAALDPEIAEAMAEQQEAVDAIRSVGLRELTDEVSDLYWLGVYNKLEHHSGWIFISIGLALLGGYALYEVFTAPCIHVIGRVGIAAVVIGFGLLLSHVIRMRMKVKPYDRYREVIR